MRLIHSDIPAAVHDRRHKEKLVAAISCYTTHESEELYGFLKISLVDINNWNEFAGGISFQSKLTDKNGSAVSRFAKVGDLIRITLHSRQSVGRLYEWLEINTIEEKLHGQTEIFFITISPVINPETDIPDPSQFMRPAGNVTLFVVRDDRKIELQVYTHIKTTGYQFFGLRDRLRHVFSTFISGSGIHEIQWPTLLKSILKAGTSRLSTPDN